MTDDTARLRRLLAEYRTIAVVGLSAQPHRPSNEVALYMRSQGYRIIPVNPAHTEVLGERCYASLEQVPEPVDIVDVFRRTEEVLPVARQPNVIGARCFWQQLGVLNKAAELHDKALEARAFSAAKGALDLIGKHVDVQAFREQIQHSGLIEYRDLSDEEIEARIAAHEAERAASRPSTH